MIAPILGKTCRLLPIRSSIFSPAVASDILDVQCGKNNIAVSGSAADETGQIMYYIYILDTRREQTDRWIINASCDRFWFLRG